jgi:hypothetical protein
LIGHVRVRLVGDGFAFVQVNVAGWSVSGIRVNRGRVEWPTAEGKNGGRFIIVTPPPESRDEIEAAILDAYERAR